MKQKVHKKYKDYFNKPITHYSEAVNLYQIEELANQKFSQQTYTYYTTGSMNGESYEENEHAFKRYKILPKVLVDVDGVDVSTAVFGEKISLPIIIAPTAMHNLAHFNGELETAKAANEMDTVICLSTMSSVSKSTIAKVAKHKWKQLYMPKDLKLAEKTIQSIEKDGYTVLVLTVDAPVMGIRDLENHGKFEGPDKRDSKTKTGTVESGLGQFFKRSFNSSMDWSIIEFIKKTTSMKIVLKGIHRADDAIKAVKYGCDGIIVSNHGGRQLDGTPGTIDMLAMISLALKKEGLKDKLEIIFDGGIRRGTDIFKAFALGANAVMCGRASLWGLGAGGKDGIIKAFDLLKRELVNAMQLSGCKTLKEITSDFIITPDSYPKF